MSEKMTIIEALKKIKNLEKKIARQNGEITSYASKLSSEKPSFESDAVQKKKVEELVQSNLDCIKEMLQLKQSVERTNLGTILTISGHTASLSEHLHLKRKFSSLQISVLKALNTSAADMRMIRATPSKDNPVVVERMFDEAKRNDSQKKIFDYLGALDEQIEVINATTYLIPL